jgi:hypothetical protein
MQKCRGKEKTGAYPWPIIIITDITLIWYILEVQFLSVHTLKNHILKVLNYRNESSLRIIDSWSYKKNFYKNNITHYSTGLTMRTTWKISTVNNEHDSTSHSPCPKYDIVFCTPSWIKTCSVTIHQTTKTLWLVKLHSIHIVTSTLGNITQWTINTGKDVIYYFSNNNNWSFKHEV